MCGKIGIHVFAAKALRAVHENYVFPKTKKNMSVKKQPRRKKQKVWDSKDERTPKRGPEA